MTSASRLSASARLALVAAALFFATMECVLAGTVVRDHRGANGASTGGVTVNGARATNVFPPPNLLNCDKCKGSGFARLRGATIRDHR